MKVGFDSNYFEGESAAADINGEWFDAQYSLIIGAIVTFAGGGSPNGVLNIDGSNDEGDTKTYASVATRTVNADGSYYIEKADFAFKYARIRYDFTSGTGTANGSLCTKGF